jgi:hypothetical protein
MAWFPTAFALMLALQYSPSSATSESHRLQKRCTFPNLENIALHYNDDKSGNFVKARCVRQISSTNATEAGCDCGPQKVYELHVEASVYGDVPANSTLNITTGGFSVCQKPYFLECSTSSPFHLIHTVDAQLADGSHHVSIDQWNRPWTSLTEADIDAMTSELDNCTHCCKATDAKKDACLFDRGTGSCCGEGMSCCPTGNDPLFGPPNECCNITTHYCHQSSTGAGTCKQLQPCPMNTYCRSCCSTPGSNARNDPVGSFVCCTNFGTLCKQPGYFNPADPTHQEACTVRPDCDEFAHDTCPNGHPCRQIDGVQWCELMPECGQPIDSTLANPAAIHDTVQLNNYTNMLSCPASVVADAESEAICCLPDGCDGNNANWWTTPAGGSAGATCAAGQSCCAKGTGTAAGDYLCCTERQVCTSRGNGANNCASLPTEFTGNPADLTTICGNAGICENAFTGVAECCGECAAQGKQECTIDGIAACCGAASLAMPSLLILFAVLALVR